MHTVIQLKTISVKVELNFVGSTRAAEPVEKRHGSAFSSADLILHTYSFGAAIFKLWVWLPIIVTCQ